MAILRKAFIIILLIGIGISCYFGYQFLEKAKKPQGNAIRAIPPSVSLIIEVRNAKEAWKKIAYSNLIWKDLVETDAFSKIHNRLLFIDSIVSSDEVYGPLLTTHSFFVSFQATEKNNFDFLLCFGLPNSISEKETENFIRKICSPASVSTTNTEGTTISVFEPSNNGPVINLAFHKRILLLSTGPLVENAIKQINSGSSLFDDGGFNKVRKTAGDKPDAAIYINHKQLPPILNVFLNETKASSFDNVNGWTELDLNIKPNELLLSGYTSPNDSAKHFLSLYEGQAPCEINTANILPYNTTTFFHSGVSDINLFMNKIKHHYGNGSSIDDINKKYNCDLEKTFTSWISNEVISFSTYGDSLQHFAAFGCNEKESTLEVFIDLCKKISAIDEKPPDTLYHRDHLIIHIPLNSLLKKVWRGFIKNIPESYITSLENYIVFSNSAEELKSLINSFENNKTLAQSDHYNDFFNGHLDTESTIYFYSAPGNSIEMRSLLLNNAKHLSDKYDNALKKIQAIGVQFSNSNDNIYTTAFIKHNPVSKKLVSTLWETILDTTISAAPQAVINHKTKTKEIFIQDDANKIYLISSTGKVLWSKQLPEKIMGKVTQIDALKNNKLQLLFNTKSSVFLIDRNGNDVKNFPVNLPAESAAPLSVFDYDHTEAYRILIPCTDKIIYNYNAEGEQVNGWNKPKTNSLVNQPVFLFQVNKTDHLACIDKEGNIHSFNRHGEKRFTLEARLKNTTGTIKIVPGKDIERTYIVLFDTTEQCIVRYFMNNEKDTIKTAGPAAYTNFVCSDINDDKTNEYILLGDKKFTVLSNDESVLFEKVFSEKIFPEIYLFRHRQKGIYSGITSAGEVLIFNSLGEEVKGFPVKGGAFFADDLNNDGSMILVCIGTSNSIFAYQIE